MAEAESLEAAACPLMGTANTMQILCEVAGFSLSGTATIPAVASEKSRNAQAAGRRIVDLGRAGRSASAIVTDAVLRNMITVTLAIGGSTNTVRHIPSLAREPGRDLDLAAFDRLSRATPCIPAVIPNGPCSVIDLHVAGGVSQVMHSLAPLSDLNTQTGGGQTWGQVVASIAVRSCDVPRTLDDPLRPEGGLAFRRGVHIDVLFDVVQSDDDPVVYCHVCGARVGGGGWCGRGGPTRWRGIRGIRIVVVCRVAPRVNARVDGGGQLGGRVCARGAGSRCGAGGLPDVTAGSALLKVEGIRACPDPF